MQEEANIGIGYPLAQEIWQQHKMIIVNPDDVAWFICLYDLLGENLIHAKIVVPRDLFGPAIVRCVLTVVEKFLNLNLLMPSLSARSAVKQRRR